MLKCVRFQGRAAPRSFLTVLRRQNGHYARSCAGTPVLRRVSPEPRSFPPVAEPLGFLDENSAFRSFRLNFNDSARAATSSRTARLRDFLRLAELFSTFRGTDTASAFESRTREGPR